MIINDTTPPTTPTLITPVDGSTITTTQKPTFDWSDSTDSESGLDYYTLHLESSNNSVSLQSMTSITVTKSVFTPTVDLDNGVYTWTVQAHDVAGNVSGYASPSATFVVSATSSVPNKVYLPIVVKDQ